MTLDEIFPNGRGDGRKFRFAGWVSDRWFEPIFRSRDYWFGLDPFNRQQACTPEGPWIEWQPPKKKKSITFYRPVRTAMTAGHYWQEDCWHSRKENFNSYDKPGSKIVGWEEKTVEVDDEN